MTRRRPRTRVLYAGLVVLSGAACDRIVGTFEVQDEHEKAPFSFTTSDCESCMLTSCAEPARLCADDGSICAPRFDCLFTCPQDEPSCRGACYEQHYAENDRTREFDACWRSECLDRCLGTRGYFPLETGPDASACDRCRLEKGCYPADGGNCAALGCEAIPSCRHLMDPASTDPASLLACGEAMRQLQGIPPCAPEALIPTSREVRTHADALACRMRSCAVECEVGRQWGCLGDYAWGGHSFGMIERGWTFLDLDGSGIGALEVRACPIRDRACDVEPAWTDANGVSCLNLPLVTGQFVGYFRLRHPDYHDTLVFPGAPLTGSVGPEADLFAKRTQFEFFSRREGVEPQPELGGITVVVSSCAYSGAPDVQLKLSGPNQGTERRWYFKDGWPTLGADRTEESGVGGFLNVTPGDYVVRAYLNDGRLAGCHTIFVEADKVTHLRLLPLDADDEATCG
jgi:hypothetical protein